MHDDERQEQEIQRELDPQSLAEIQKREEMLRLQEEERRIADTQKFLVLEKMIRGVYFLVGALQVLLILRFSLCLLGANPDNQVALVLYKLSSPFYAPFSNLFGNPECAAGRPVFDVNLIVALVVYAVLAWLFAKLLRVFWS
ncbi:YggT family protein [Oscillatoria sp. FACHB-1406]|uniref:YggT family protein n=1 Tax=Oscillatoria sp. FACHB-1406 TaxID=2692846 RepID=UPI001689BD90|nr:YggT family protein [Oscillatoria sp. FACHB-1406]MBD2577840.1 YggT family protein [Oscillatoria sp. FACHB-1406]